MVVSTLSLRPDQEKFVLECSQSFAKGNKAVLGQGATGFGKTVCFSATVDRYNKKSAKKVFIAVHRIELLRQTIATLKNWYGIEAQGITKETRRIEDRICYVGMCETVFRRLTSNPQFLPEIGLTIFDEAHVGNFKKLHKFFPDSLILGFTATPIAATKKDPLKNYYEDIVCGPQISELIKLGSLCQNHTHSIKGVRRKDLKIVNGEFDINFMGDEFSKLRNVQNVINHYKELCEGTKALVFNCNIEHNLVMNEAWLAAGYQSRCIDSDNTTDLERDETFRWFKETDGAILNNVGIATMGYDEPSIKTIITNRATTSPVLVIQMAGRGARPFIGKDYFTILDMGGNYRNDAHGDWCSDRDWKEIFWNPPKAKQKLGAQPVKDCPNPACQAIIPLQSTVCPFCGYEFPKKIEQYDTKVIELELITKNINVSAMIEANDTKGRKDYFTLFQIGYNLVAQLKYKVGAAGISEAWFEKITEIFQEKAQEWCKIKGKRWNSFHQGLTRDFMMREFKSTFGFEPISDVSRVSNIQNVKSIA